MIVDNSVSETLPRPTVSEHMAMGVCTSNAAVLLAQEMLTVKIGCVCQPDGQL